MFTINELLGRGKEIIITDDRGQRLSPFTMVPGYGGWGNNAPTKWVAVNGRRANFVSALNQTSLQYLTLEWESQKKETVMASYNEKVYKAIFEVYDKYEKDICSDLRELVEAYLGQQVEDAEWEEAVSTFYRYKL